MIRVESVPRRKVFNWFPGLKIQVNNRVTLDKCRTNPKPYDMNKCMMGLVKGDTPF